MEKKFAAGKLVLGYWDIRGLAQPIRYLLAHIGLDYEDKQYFYGEAPGFSKDAWFSVKASSGFDFPNLPYLIDGDLKITESHAIYRYLCNKYRPELLGKSVADKAKVDMVMGVSQDIRSASYNMIYETGDWEGLKVLGYERFAPISKFLAHNKFIVGEYPTFPDFFVYENIELFDFICD